jgi:RNA polymerase sigma-70 factor (ECF subfamily)
MEDFQVVRQRGFAETADWLREHWRKRIHSWCSGFCDGKTEFPSPDDEADDLTNRVIVRAAEKRKSFGGDSSLSTWLYRIAINLLIDELRSRRAEKRKGDYGAASLALDDEDEEEEGAVSEESLRDDDAPDPFDAVVRDELRDKVRVCLYSLPEKERMVIVLIHMEDMTAGEVAEFLEVSQRTVQTRKAKGEQLMRECLEEYVTGGDSDDN